MKRALIGLAFALAAAAPASASTIGTDSKHCGCTLTEIPPEPHVTIDTTGGWDAFVGTAEEKAAAQLADLLWEPKPEPSMWAWVCAQLPKLPWVPKIPTIIVDPHDLGPDWRPLKPILCTVNCEPKPIPEPASVALFGLGLVAVARRFRTR